MSRWQIDKIILYSHDNRRSELDFKRNSVNIIVGESHTGKSAISEIIDYVLGSSECNIPAYVRDCLSWTGILWSCDDTRMLILRALPLPSHKANNSCYVDIGRSVVVPSSSSDIDHFDKLDPALAYFERQLGIGDARSEDFGESLKGPHKVSIRHLVPFIIVSDDVIISKNTLLRNTDDSKRRQGILDSIPYYFGISDESALEKSVRLRGLKRQLARIERDRGQTEAYRDLEESRAKALVQAAVNLGLSELSQGQLESMDLRTLLNVLDQVAGWDVSARSSVGSGPLPKIQEELSVLETQEFAIREKIRQTKQDLEIVDAYSGSANRQRLRLETIGIFKSVQNPNVCPLCDSGLSSTNKPVEAIRSGIERLSEDLGTVARDRPRLDRYISELTGQLFQTKERIQSLRIELSEILRAETEVSRLNDVNVARIKLSARAEDLVAMHLASETLDVTGGQGEVVREQIREIESEIDVEARKEALDNLEEVISFMATGILDDLPLDQRFRNRPVYLDLREARTGLRTPNRVEAMRQLGSDENYLSLHVALFLAFHRFFAAQGRPVPGVLLFDQISRPYYPPEEVTGIVSVEASADAVSLNQYFDSLFAEVDAQPSLQIIVLEHADLKSSQRYQASVIKRWKMNVEGLIPEGWPERKP